MKIKILSLFILLSYLYSSACSIYKITMYGNTYVGNNVDFWNSNTRIWFEKGQTAEYGSMFFGIDNLVPNGGMNENGLTFGMLSLNTEPPQKKTNKLAFNRSIVFRDIMKKCQNVDEVSVILNKYDLSPINRGMIFFVDKTGNYLIVEPDTMIKGNNDNYLLSNFCPSKTPDLSSVKIPFYQVGRKMLEAKVDTSFSYLRALSDTLHQSWIKNSGGTLYTAIYDLNKGTFNLFFYHDYSYSIKFDLKNELNKKDTVLVIPALFPTNVKGQEQFKKYNKTKELMNIIKEQDLAKDSATMAEYIKTEELGPFICFFETDIYIMGYDFLNKNKKSSAINLFKLNVKYCPNSWYSYNSLGNIYFSDKRYASSLVYYKKSLEYKPDNNEYTKEKIKKINRRLRH